MTDISLRDYFAGKVVQGILANEFESLELFKSKRTKEESVKELANVVYLIADALVDKGEKPHKTVVVNTIDKDSRSDLTQSET